MFKTLNHRFTFFENFTGDMDVPSSILVYEEGCADLKNLAIFCSMAFSSILACKDGGILSIWIEVRAFSIED